MQILDEKKWKGTKIMENKALDKLKKKWYFNKQKFDKLDQVHVAYVQQYFFL